MKPVWTYRVLTWAGWALIVVWVLWLLGQAAATVIVDTDFPSEWLWWLIAAGVGCLLARGGARVSLIVRLHRNGRPGSGTITNLRYRGAWGDGGENATQYHWFDLWLWVVPASCSKEAPFTAFTAQPMGSDRRGQLAEGLTVPVVYDPATGITVLAFDGELRRFGPRTLRMLGRVRRMNRRGPVDR